MKLNVPFFANTPDNTHCYQAGIRMVLKYFIPEKDFSWKELDRLTAKKPKLWIWPLKGLLHLKRMGFEIINIEDFDYQRFSQTGEQYLMEKYGPEVGREQVKHSDIPQERRLARKFIKEIKTTFALPKISTIRKYLDQKFLVHCNVNANILNGKSGYLGHFVLVIGYEGNKYLYIHDPGLPSNKDRKVTNELFNKAWAYPNESVKNLTGIRLRRAPRR